MQGQDGYSQAASSLIKWKPPMGLTFTHPALPMIVDTQWSLCWWLFPLVIKVGTNSCNHHWLHAGICTKMGEDTICHRWSSKSCQLFLVYGITWTFNDHGGCKMQEQPAPYEPNIELTAGDDMMQSYTIQWMPMTKGICTLGIWLAPNGNDNDKF